jgi:lipopolysaccharide export system protein LptA
MSGRASRCARAASGAITLAVALALSLPLGAEPLNNKFGGFSGDSKEPIDIESDMLVVHDKEKLATFKGNVKAVQGKTILRATELDVHYAGGDRLGLGGGETTGATTAPPADGGASPAANEQDDSGTQITKIEAKGNVVITGEDNQTTTSDWALYDVPSRLVTVGGNVVLTQGENVLKGDRLVIDLNTGQSRFENTASSDAGGGRIRALFMPKGGALPKGIKPGEAKPGAGPAAKPNAGAAGSPGRDFNDDAALPLDPMRQQ